MVEEVERQNSDASEVLKKLLR